MLCFDYHSSQDQRRNPFEVKYLEDLCPQLPGCPLPDCPFSHNQIEKLFHPSLYKTNYCKFIEGQEVECAYNNFCSFAHNQNDIQIELLHTLKADQNFLLFKYKTQFCPFKFVQHPPAKCVYAHDASDIRRNPLLHFYTSKMCREGREGQLGQLCPRGVDCMFSHNKFESDFNPSHLVKDSQPPPNTQFISYSFGLFQQYYKKYKENESDILSDSSQSDYEYNYN